MVEHAFDTFETYESTISHWAQDMLENTISTSLASIQQHFKAQRICKALSTVKDATHTWQQEAEGDEALHYQT